MRRKPRIEWNRLAARRWVTGSHPRGYNGQCAERPRKPAGLGCGCPPRNSPWTASSSGAAHPSGRQSTSPSMRQTGRQLRNRCGKSAPWEFRSKATPRLTTATTCSPVTATRPVPSRHERELWLRSLVPPLRCDGFADLAPLISRVHRCEYGCVPPGHACPVLCDEQGLGLQLIPDEPGFHGFFLLPAAVLTPQS